MTEHRDVVGLVAWLAQNGRNTVAGGIMKKDRFIHNERILLVSRSL